MTRRFENADLIVGWREIGAQVGRPAQSLAQAWSQGRLPVAPIKIGATVAMTRAMVEALREAMDARPADSALVGSRLGQQL